ncbi:MAG: hypothetical protein F2813_01445 [Actinobacteria bacterium]|uniref:FAD:protein FMN transferase n=1 Tax=freshwater metagenome TaxID=449393 RepID=A0A6J5ZCY4_9ZZZZ|nr:hypothetical protein [Actinomycetota bacterium]
MQLTSLSFDAMGTGVHVIYGGADPQHAALAISRVQELERLWSRFLPDSEVSRINAAGGGAVAASPETIDLVEKAVEGWRITGGLFDPTVLGDLVALGYDRTFKDLEALPPQAPASDNKASHRSGGREEPGVTVDRGGGTVALTSDRGIDSGGIGKGLAADIVATALVEAGAPGALVNLGGDLRSAGRSPTGGWRVDVDNPFDPLGPPAARFRLEGDTALVTSSSQGRRWRDGDEERHHLLDPASGRPANSDIASVTVIADDGWRAEALSKAAFLSGRERAMELLPESSATGMIVGRDGAVDWVAGSRPYRVPERVIARPGTG